MILLKLFIEFFKIGLFSFGGGLSTLPYIYEMARTTAWITNEDITNILTVSQVTPGPLACNIGTILGFNANGILGAIICNIAFIIPAICLMSVCFKFYKKIQENETANKIIKIIRAAALAIVVTSSISIIKVAFLKDENIILSLNYKSILVALVIIFITRFKKIGSIKMILLSSVIAGIISV